MRIGLSLLALPLVPACLSVRGPVVEEAELDTSGEINLHWQIDSAENNYGFFFKRADSEDGPWERVSELIPGVGTTSNVHTFDWVDTGLVRGSDHWYQLYEVSYSGVEEMMGTISAHCRTVAEDIVHDRRKMLGEHVDSLGDAVTSPIVSGEWAAFLHPRRGETVALIADWRGWEENPLPLVRLAGTHWLVAEEPLTDLPTEGEYLFLVIGEGSPECRLDTHNPEQRTSAERDEAVSALPAWGDR